MSLGLSNTKLGANPPAQRLGLSSRKHIVSTSIAEQAIFIPKPHKRVTFKMNLPGSGNTQGNKPGYEPIQTSKPKGISGSNGLTRGELGENGVTARFNQGAYQGSPGGYVKMEIDYNPTKQNEVIATQEEGRQVNHKEIHFTQQYDQYGRPRIGFSREPYDFAATKFVSVTNQIAFQQSMASVHDKYNEYLLSSNGSASDVTSKGEGADVADIPVFGNSSGNMAQAEAMPALGAGGQVSAPASSPTGFGGGDEEHADIPIFGNSSNGTESTYEAPDTSFFLGNGKMADVGVSHSSAKDVFESQRVEVIPAFGNGSKDNNGTPALGQGSDASLDKVFEGSIDAGEIKTVDVTA